MRTESRGGALLLDSEDLLKFFPGVMTSDCSIGPRILAVVDAIFKVAERGRHRKVWREFRADALLRQEHHVTEEELRVLETLAPLGMVTGSGDILFVLSYIRSALQARQKAIANA